MLYLIRDRDYIKIGYTANIDQRQKAYETTNCYAEIIMTKDGTRKDELNLHKLCNKWHYKNEWFHYNDEIVKIFEEYRPDYEERLITLETKIKEIEETLKNINVQLSVFKQNFKTIDSNQTKIEDIVERLLSSMIFRDRF